MRAPVKLKALSRLALLTLLACRPTHPAPPKAALPPLMVWAWERPEDLSFLDPATTGVAVLSQTITLTPGAFDTHLRQQPVKLPEGIARLALTRIEHGPESALPQTQEARAALVRQLMLPIRREPTQGRLVGLQIDFDARESEYPAYAALLAEVRAELPRPLLLSATGLASWCTEKPWFVETPVDLWVPQFFRMGRDFKAFRDRLSDRRLPPSCQRAWGLALDEPFTERPDETLFVFKPASPFTREDFVNITPGQRR